MTGDIFDEDYYERFYKNFIRTLDGPNITQVKLENIRAKAFKTATKTKHGSHGWRSAVSSRVAPKTVYLGSESIRLPQPTQLHKEIIRNAPEELEKVLYLMRTLPFIHLKRQMGDNGEFTPICNLYISVADRKNYRLAYMWGRTLKEPPKKTKGPEFIMVHIPEEHHINQQVLVLPEYNLNIALGTDYMGEDKKGFLRQAMWTADERGMLGLHSGTKLVTVRDAQDGKLKKIGVFLFGLTATGKSTWSCHQLGLDHKNGEKTEVTQDDIAFLKRDGAALGSESGFFVKTDVDKKYQEAMYYALIDKSALFENVMIDSGGNPDFLDESLCSNGRAVIQRDKIRVMQNGKLIPISSDSINLPSLEHIDGVIFAFITRRNTIMTFAQQLNMEQAVLAYLWGESTHSYASQPAKAGESVRIVGTDPFIIGSRARKVNRFYNILKELTEKYPDKVKFFQYNTGGVGEIIESYEEDGFKRKKLIQKVNRVPLNLMAAIQRGDLRGTNRYERGRLGTKAIAYCETENGNSKTQIKTQSMSSELQKFKPGNYYSNEQIDSYINNLIEGRRKFTEEIADEGLSQEIIDAAEKSFAIGRRRKVMVTKYREFEEEKEEKEKEQKGEEVESVSFPINTKSRPPRSFRGRR